MVKCKSDGGVRGPALVDLKKVLAKMTEYIYVIKAQNGLFKVGITKDPLIRFKSIYANSPIDVSLLFCIECQDSLKIEREIHAKFSSKCHHGEWLALSDDDVLYIETLGSKCHFDTTDRAGLKAVKGKSTRYSSLCQNCNRRSWLKHLADKLLLNCKCGNIEYLNYPKAP